jgi:hypothetical protein
LQNTFVNKAKESLLLNQLNNFGARQQKNLL